jgi:hypothetical protein
LVLHPTWPSLHYTSSPSWTLNPHPPTRQRNAMWAGPPRSWVQSIWVELVRILPFVAIPHH